MALNLLRNLQQIVEQIVLLLRRVGAGNFIQNPHQLRVGFGQGFAHRTRVIEWNQCGDAVVFQLQ